MVLDGAVSPPFGTFTQLADQMAGFDSAFRAFMQWCLDSGDCPFDGPLDRALAEAHALALSVDGKGSIAATGACWILRRSEPASRWRSTTRATGRTSR